MPRSAALSRLALGETTGHGTRWQRMTVSPPVFSEHSPLAPAGPLVGLPGPPPISRRSFDPLGPVVLLCVHCCWSLKPACSNRLQVSGRMLLRPSSPAGASRNELHFSLSACFRLCGASCVIGLVVCEQRRAAGRLPGISPSNPAAVHVSPYFVCAWWLRIHRRHCQTGF